MTPVTTKNRWDTPRRRRAIKTVQMYPGRPLLLFCAVFHSLSSLQDFRVWDDSPRLLPMMVVEAYSVVRVRQSLPHHRHLHDSNSLVNNNCNTMGGSSPSAKRMNSIHTIAYAANNSNDDHEVDNVDGFDRDTEDSSSRRGIIVKKKKTEVLSTSKHEAFGSAPSFDSGNDSSSSSTTSSAITNNNNINSNNSLGEYDPYERLGGREVNVGDPQIKVREKERSVTSILKELAAIQQQGPQKYCILGTRHCSYMHQQIIELLAYALVLSGNHVYTSGAGGTHAATIRGALRAERPDLLTVVLPQSMEKQPKESQELLKKVDDVISMPQNDHMSLDMASRICNSYLLKQTDQLISFAFHESKTVIEATKEAKELEMLVTVLYLD